MDTVKVLDHGSVSLVEVWGSEENIIRAARQSTDGSFRGWPGDEKLLSYLYRNGHMSPFEMAGAIFAIKAPIFVFREWHRHRTQSYNEMSARYVPIPDEHYIPTVDRFLRSGGSNKQAQGTGDAVLSPLTAAWAQKDIAAAYQAANNSYQYLLTLGVPKELARLVMPVGRYSKMWASANLRNWLQFLELREASGAQWEIQQYALAVHSLLRDHFPRTLALFEEKT